MDAFEYRDGCLWVEGARVEDVAREHGTPLYLYSKGTLVDHYEKLVDALAEFDPLICYSVKVNGNLSVLRTLAAEGSGFDLVSGGELFRALRAGGEPERFVFAGVGKTDRELDEALDAGIRLFTVESVPELETLSARAAGRGKRASVALRVNPDVDAHTHEHITTGVAEAKFGIDLDTIDGIFADPDRFPGVLIDGFHMHIGSQITETGPYALALERLAPLYAKYRSEKTPLGHLDIGGGFGINYTGGEAKPAGAFAEAIAPRVREIGARLVLEPGRFIAGNAGVLVCRVIYVKRTPAKWFVIVDAGMNDLMRPLLYGARHAIWPVQADGPPPERGGDAGAAKSLEPADVVGPICESGDFLGKGVKLPEVKRGDLIAVFSAGAYGFTMSSNYNARPRAAEILVDGSDVKLARRRETYEDLVRGEE